MPVIHHIPKNIRRLAKRMLSSQLPRGIDFFTDIRRWLPNQSMKTIFDVGANVGQTTRDFALYFPGAEYHSFEPEPGNYRLLERNLRELEHAFTHELALSNTTGTASLELSNLATMHRLASEKESRCSDHAVGVKTSTLDVFCVERDISQIDLLKIDTEGHDLLVLEGARTMLSNQSIAIIHIEAGISSDNHRHVPFSAIQFFMNEFGYRSFAIYEQVHEWPTGRPDLRRINAAFISPECSRMNTVSPRADLANS